MSRKPRLIVTDRSGHALQRTGFKSIQRAITDVNDIGFAFVYCEYLGITLLRDDEDQYHVYTLSGKSKTFPSRRGSQKLAVEKFLRLLRKRKVYYNRQELEPDPLRPFDDEYLQMRRRLEVEGQLPDRYKDDVCVDDYFQTDD